MIPIRDFLIMRANEFQNDFVSVTRFSEYHGLTYEEGKQFLELATKVRSHPHPEE